jgi:hypothetical protein
MYSKAKTDKWRCGEIGSRGTVPEEYGLKIVRVAGGYAD